MKSTVYCILATAMLLLSITSPALAQDGESTDTSIVRGNAPKEEAKTQDPKDIYSGIIPGVRNLVNHVSKALAKGENNETPNQLTWIGFQPEKNRTRVFLQVASVPSYQMSRSDDKTTITLTLPNTKITTRNVTRPVIATPYKRAIKTIHAKRGRKNTVIVKMTVKPDADPQISQSGNFLYIDFAHTPKEEETSK